MSGTPQVDTGTLLDAAHRLNQRVYFEHTDFSGIVYHARYLDFLEHGRTDYVRMLGVHHSAMRDGAYGESLAFAVHRMEIDFKKSASIDDVLTVETRRGTLHGLRLVFDQCIKRDTEVLLEAKVTVVLVNPEGKPRRYPPEMLAQLGVTRDKF
ncbi:MAG: YbgC/FadM family acyl-CoA thioesterase [Ahrensia sp.]|nr:YbgC/FadM family acyl-CoA thioesterase [Ahrensia sp.]